MIKFKRINMYHLLYIIFMVAISWTIFAYRGKLPDKIPTHFSFDGTPDQWSRPGSFLFFFLMALATGAFFYFLIFIIPRLRKYPNALNVPNKEKFLALPLDKQQIFWDLTKEYIAACNVMVTFLWLTLCIGTVNVAMGYSEKLPFWAIWPAFILLTIVTVIYLIIILRVPKKLINENEKH